MVKLLLQGSTGSRTSESALLSIAVICISITVAKKTVLPSSLRFRPPLRIAKGYKLMVRTGFSFLKLRRNECHSSILRLRALFSRSLSELSALINNSETSWVEEFCSSKELQTFTKQREKHDRNSVTCSVRGLLLIQAHL